MGGCPPDKKPFGVVDKRRMSEWRISHARHVCGFGRHARFWPIRRSDKKEQCNGAAVLDCRSVLQRVVVVLAFWGRHRVVTTFGAVLGERLQDCWTRLRYKTSRAQAGPLLGTCFAYRPMRRGDEPTRGIICGSDLSIFPFGSPCPSPSAADS
jgi:hypothetical protein